MGAWEDVDEGDQIREARLWRDGSMDACVIKCGMYLTTIQDFKSDMGLQR